MPKTLGAHGWCVSALALLPDGRLVSGGWDSTIKLWNLETGEAEATLSLGTSDSSVFALLPLGSGRFASASLDRKIRIWTLRGDMWSGTVAFVAEAAITALAFDTWHGVLAAGDGSGRVHFLRLEGSARANATSAAK